MNPFKFVLGIKGAKGAKTSPQSKQDVEKDEIKVEKKKKKDFSRPAEDPEWKKLQKKGPLGESRASRHNTGIPDDEIEGSE